MSFLDYLRVEYCKNWSDLYLEADIMRLIQYCIDYEIYCHSNNLKPTWSNDNKIVGCETIEVTE